MKYNIIPNYYAPMCGDWKGQDDVYSSHGIIIQPCNFKCRFCNNQFHEGALYRNYSELEFAATVYSLLKLGNRFKFSGGEQTINPRLIKDLEIVKDIGGMIFLDTNGSRPQVLKNILDRQLIDVVGISLKGLTKQEAIETSNVRQTSDCWESVHESISAAASANYDLRVIVTYVFYNERGYNELCEFANIISNYSNIYLKINNLLHDKHHDDTVEGIPPNEFVEMAQRFVQENPTYQNRVIVVNNKEAIRSFSEILFL